MSSAVGQKLAHQIEFETASTLFTTNETDLNSKRDLIESSKSKWEMRLSVLSSSTTKLPAKDELLNELKTELTTYESLVAARNLSGEILTTLGRAIDSCRTWSRSLSPEVYETLKGITSLDTNQVSKEQAIVTENIATLEDYRGRMQDINARMLTRLPKAAQELDALVKFVKTDKAEWRLTGYLKGKVLSLIMDPTPNLTAALTEKDGPIAVVPATST